MRYVGYLSLGGWVGPPVLIGIFVLSMWATMLRRIWPWVGRIPWVVVPVLAVLAWMTSEPVVVPGVLALVLVYAPTTTAIAACGFVVGWALRRSIPLLWGEPVSPDRTVSEQRFATTTAAAAVFAAPFALFLIFVLTLFDEVSAPSSHQLPTPPGWAVRQIYNGYATGSGGTSSHSYFLSSGASNPRDQAEREYREFIDQRGWRVSDDDDYRRERTGHEVIVSIETLDNRNVSRFDWADLPRDDEIAVVTSFADSGDQSERTWAFSLLSMLFVLIFVPGLLRSAASRMRQRVASESSAA